MPVIWWQQLFSFLRIQWHKYRATLCWFLVCLVVGMILGIVTIHIGDVSADEINYRLIDGNILNATATDSRIGGFVWQRILSIMMPIIVVLILATLSRFTAYAVFPVVLIHGYSLTVAVWWTFFYYNLTAILLIVFYLGWLLLVTAVIFVGLLWALECGANLRMINRQCGQQRHWSTLIRGAMLFIGLAVILGFFEYLMFWTVLGKIVYKPR